MEAIADDKPRYSSFALYSLVVCVTLLLVSWLSCHVLSRYYYQKGIKYFDSGKFVVAERQISKAWKWLPGMSFPGDRKRLKIAEGDMALKKGQSSRRIADFLNNMEKAEQFFRGAVTIEPRSIDGYTGLARATGALEKMYPFAKKEPYPKKALPLFHHLLALMPVNLYSHSLFTRYLYSMKMDVELKKIVFESITLYPPIVKQLRTQPFYKRSMDTMIEKALFSAVNKGIYVGSAYQMLSYLATLGGDSKKAVEFYRQSLQIAVHKDLSADYLSLGRLYLKDGQFKQCEISYCKALENGDRSAYMEVIWHHYKTEKKYVNFLQFLDMAGEKYRLSDVVEIVRAKCLIAMGRPAIAKIHLLKISSPDYQAEGLYLQSKIAELQKDWDTMELRSQRATVLDPDNAGYHYLFSRALRYQKKWKQAELEASRALTHAQRKNPWLYNHRAWLRWSQNDLAGALDDWKRAAEISPDISRFHYNMALVYEKRGDIPAALKQLRKALAVQPDDKAVLALIAKLQK